MNSDFLIGTEPFVEYLLSGVYRVVVTDALGCTVEIDDVDATTGVSFPERQTGRCSPIPRRTWFHCVACLKGRDVVADDA